MEVFTVTLAITKSARKFGYVIWSSKTDLEIRTLLGNESEVFVFFNGLSLGMKSIDWKYHRISIGYKFTRALPDTAKMFNLSFCNGVLEVEAINV